MAAESLGWWGVPLGILAGTLRGSAPFLFVSLGECITEKSGKINLGIEGTLLMGAMSAYGVAYLTQDVVGACWAPWLGVVAAGIAGMQAGGIHGWVSHQARRHRHAAHVGDEAPFQLHDREFGAGCCNPHSRPQSNL